MKAGLSASLRHQSQRKEVKILYQDIHKSIPLLPSLKLHWPRHTYAALICKYIELVLSRGHPANKDAVNIL